MNTILVIAEKPSVARELGVVLGAQARRKGYLEGKNMLITWAVGHLVSIAEPAEQHTDWGGRWTMRYLPMLPTRFVLNILPQTADQFAVISALLSDERVQTVVNATDAGREGELIFRRIYLMAGCKKPIKRLWANDMTEAGLQKAYTKMVDGEEKRHLGYAAFARAEADWLVGMNFSRLFTLRSGSLITVGRVQTPVLKLVVDRRLEIEQFSPQDYWSVEALFCFEGFSFNSSWFSPPEYKESKIWEKTLAEQVLAECTEGVGRVLSTQNKKGSQKPPLPFDLTTLQKEANSRLGFSAQTTLSLVQDLYEKHKLVTYPRTDSRYLTQELYSQTLEHLRALYAVYPELSAQAAKQISSGKKFVCVNDKKVTDHHAIIPTCTNPHLEKLPPDAAAIYDMIARRFMAAFLPPATFSSSVVWMTVYEHRFRSTGKVFQDKGWLAAEPWRTAEDNPLPALRKDAQVSLEELSMPAHKTKPPAHYTDASLLAAMETAGKLVDDDVLRDALKERGLGTPATRAQIIETLLARKYMRKEGKRLVATDLGVWAAGVVAALIPQMTSAELTGEWEFKLREMEQGRFAYGQFMHEVRSLVFSGVQDVRRSTQKMPPCPVNSPHKNNALPSSKRGRT